MNNTRFIFTVLLLFLLLSFGFTNAQENPFPGKPEIADAKAGDLIVKPGTYLKYRADYGTLVVPENRNKPDARLIHLPVIRIHATGKNPAEPVFFLTGGPGIKNVNTEDVLIKAGQKDLGILGFLLEHHDLIVVGYRGVDGSVVLNCPEVVEALKVEKNPLSSENLENLGNALLTAFQRLKREGIDVDGYSVIEVVDDLEAVRRALGLNKINLWGGSYGTTVAYFYCLRYPESIHRTLMTAANAPGLRGLWKPEIVDAQLNYYANLWKKNPSCVERTPDLIKTIRNVLQNLPEKWQNMSIDRDKVKIMTFYFLFDTGSAAQIFDAFVSAEKGDYSKLAYLSYAYDVAFPTFIVWGDFFSKIFSIGDVVPGKDYEKEMDPPGSILGSPLSKLFLGPMKYGGWPIKPISKEYREHQYIDVQTLLVSGSIDFSSPVENVKNELLPYLRNGKLIILSETGHSDIIQPEAFQHLVETFFLKGIVDDSKYKYEPMNFTPSQPFLKWLLRMGN